MLRGKGGVRIWWRYFESQQWMDVTVSLWELSNALLCRETSLYPLAEGHSQQSRKKSTGGSLEFIWNHIAFMAINPGATCSFSVIGHSLWFLRNLPQIILTLKRVAKKVQCRVVFNSVKLEKVGGVHNSSSRRGVKLWCSNIMKYESETIKLIFKKSSR
jgi:hypothetical protein